MKVLLASASPRRRELLKKLFHDFDVVSPDVDESVQGNNPYEETIRIALKKAKAVDSSGYDIVISCDTVVYMDGIFYGKPLDEERAEQYIKDLSGKTHLVITGVAILTNSGVITFYEQSNVTFYPLFTAEIKSYISEFKPLDKAGAYGIQDNVIVESYEGCYDNIVGLPTERLRMILRLNKLIR